MSKNHITFLEYPRCLPAKVVMPIKPSATTLEQDRVRIGFIRDNVRIGSKVWVTGLTIPGMEEGDPAEPFDAWVVLGKYADRLWLNYYFNSRDTLINLGQVIAFSPQPPERH